MKNLLTIAGSDSGGGAGIQADIKTFAAHGGYGMSVITSVTAQNTMGVTAIHDIPADMVCAQMDAVFSDIRVDGVKVGMLSNPEIVSAVADRLRHYAPKIIIVDPVMVSTSGSKLLSDDAVRLIKSELIPFATMVTPNIPEAEVLTGLKISSTDDMGKAAEIIGALGCRYVLVKGGHLSDTANDLLYDSDGEIKIFEGTRLKSKNTHGTGCSISSAICANLAKGMDAAKAVGEAKKYIRVGIENSVSIGHGSGPIHHFYDLWRTSEPNIEAQ